jgi:hypothetical protein
MKPLNRFISVQSFKMASVSTVARIIHANNWAISMDLKDAFFHLPIHQTQTIAPFDLEMAPSPTLVSCSGNVCRILSRHSAPGRLIRPCMRPVLHPEESVDAPGFQDEPKKVRVNTQTELHVPWTSLVLFRHDDRSPQRQAPGLNVLQTGIVGLTMGDVQIPPAFLRKSKFCVHRCPQGSPHEPSHSAMNPESPLKGIPECHSVTRGQTVPSLVDCPQIVLVPTLVP